MKWELHSEREAFWWKGSFLVGRKLLDGKESSQWVGSFPLVTVLIVRRFPGEEIFVEGRKVPVELGKVKGGFLVARKHPDAVEKKLPGLLEVSRWVGNFSGEESLHWEGKKMIIVIKASK